MAPYLKIGSGILNAPPGPAVRRLSLSMLSASSRSLSWKIELCDKPGTRVEDKLELKTRKFQAWASAEICSGGEIFGGVFSGIKTSKRKQ